MGEKLVDPGWVVGTSSDLGVVVGSRSSRSASDRVVPGNTADKRGLTKSSEHFITGDPLRRAARDAEGLPSG
jgi:hypothetical protein